MNHEQLTAAPHTFSHGWSLSLLEGQRKTDSARAVVSQVPPPTLCGFKTNCRPEECGGFVQSLWQLPATCGRITQGDMPNCKVARVNPKLFNSWLATVAVSVQQGWSRTSLGTSSAGRVKRQVSHEQYKSHHISTLGCAGCHEPSSAAALRQHEEHGRGSKGGLLSRSGSQAVK